MHLWVGFSLLLFMSQELIDVVYFFCFSFIENNPDDKVDDRKLWLVGSPSTGFSISNSLSSLRLSTSSFGLFPIKEHQKK